MERTLRCTYIYRFPGVWAWGLQHGLPQDPCRCPRRSNSVGMAAWPACVRACLTFAGAAASDPRQHLGPQDRCRSRRCKGAERGGPASPKLMWKLQGSFADLCAFFARPLLKFDVSVAAYTWKLQGSTAAG